MVKKEEVLVCETGVGFRLRLLLRATKTVEKKLAQFLKMTLSNVSLWTNLKARIPIFRIEEILAFFEQRQINVTKQWLLRGEGPLPVEIPSKLLTKETIKRELMEKRFISYPFPSKLDIKKCLILETKEKFSKELALKANENLPLSLYLENNKIIVGYKINNIELLHNYLGKYLLIEKTNKTIFLGYLDSISKLKKNFTFKIKYGICSTVNKKEIKSFAEVQWIKAVE